MSPTPPPGRPPATILLVDDDPELAAALTPHLEGCGWRVAYARDGDEAVRATGFDAVVIDMMLPHRSGFAVVQHLRAEFGDALPVLMTSAFDAPEHRAYASLVGVTVFVAKPFALNELLGLLGALLPK